MEAVQQQPPPTRRQRFFGSIYWLILKNVLGWLLILAALIAGPTVPGPGGIPLFLIGFALVSFPGKRRLTARVLRGKPVRFPGRPFVLISAAVAVAAPAVLLTVTRTRSRWLAEQYERGSVAALVIYLLGVSLTWMLARLFPHALNLLLRLVSRARRKFRPWLRHHRIRLLPPRWRTRHAYEAGSGPFRLKDEILKYTRRKGR